MERKEGREGRKEGRKDRRALVCVRSELLRGATSHTRGVRTNGSRQGGGGGGREAGRQKESFVCVSFYVFALCTTLFCVCGSGKISTPKCVLLYYEYLCRVLRWGGKGWGQPTGRRCCGRSKIFKFQEISIGPAVSPFPHRIPRFG